MRVHLLVAVVICGVAGCTGDVDPPASDAPKAATTLAEQPMGTKRESEPPPAAPRKVVGGPDSRCDLPVEFALPADWNPGQLERRTLRADFELACHIRAPGEGRRGTMGVWLDEQPDRAPEAALRAFVGHAAGSVEQPAYAKLKAAERAGSQVHYVRTLPRIHEQRHEAAFAVSTADGMAIVALSGSDREEYVRMLPAYVLAKTTVQVRP